MAARSLNKVQLIGNLTRDPELRYTPQGTAVCTLGLATNRSWVTDTGDRREDTEFHRLVAWNKLAELCAQLLFKGRKVFVEGRLQTRQWTAQDGTPRQTTEIVISDMIILDSRQAAEAMRAQAVEEEIPEEPAAEEEAATEPEVKGKGGSEDQKKRAKAGSKGGAKPGKGEKSSSSAATGRGKKGKTGDDQFLVEPDDIPF